MTIYYIYNKIISNYIIMNCEYIRYYEEPQEKYVCMSMSLFLPQKYKKLTYGIEREVAEKKKESFLKHLIYNAKNIMSNYFPKNYYYRIYYDESINDDERFKKLIEVLKKNKRFQMVKYKCHGVFNNRSHLNLFGTLLRFHPLFDKDSPNIKVVAILDADNVYTKEWLKNLENFINDNDYNIMTYQGLLESPFYKLDRNSDLEIDKKLNKIFFRGGMTVIKKGDYLNYEIWDKYFNHMYEQQDFMNKVRYLDFKKYAFFPESKEKSYYAFEYGMDEIFLNFILKKMIREDRVKLKIHRYINKLFHKFFIKRFTEFIEYNYKHNHELCMEFLKKLGGENNRINFFWFKKWINNQKSFEQLLNILSQSTKDLKKLYIQTDFMDFIENKNSYKNQDIKPFETYLTTLDKLN